MPTYVIGDVQGCHAALECLLEKISFNHTTDQLWFTGDLINRGPDSLRTLRFVRDLGDRARCVLGNHDLHLLAVAAGSAKTRKRDTLDDILSAPDCKELIDWLRQQPLAYFDQNYLMVHAGLAPHWNLEQTLQCAHEVEVLLRSDHYVDFLQEMYGNKPACWHEQLNGQERLRCITNYLTRVRFCTSSGEMCFKSKGPPGSQPAGLLPWFRIPDRASAGLHIVFGHWSTLGEIDDPGIHALDSGCVWGGSLTALRLGNSPERLSVDCGSSRPVTTGV